jgi:hypothetical protein
MTGIECAFGRCGGTSQAGAKAPAASEGGGMSKNLRKLVRLTLNRAVMAHSMIPPAAASIALNPLCIVEVHPDIYHGICRGSVVYLRGRPRHLGSDIYVTERRATVERRVREAFGGAAE